MSCLINNFPLASNIFVCCMWVNQVQVNILEEGNEGDLHHSSETYTWHLRVNFFFLQYFIDDTDPLWERHCCREFKGTKPKSGQSWRELYMVSIVLLHYSSYKPNSYSVSFLHWFHLHGDTSLWVSHHALAVISNPFKKHLSCRCPFYSCISACLQTDN